MSREEYDKLVEEFKALVKGTKFEQITETDLIDEDLIIYMKVINGE